MTETIRELEGTWEELAEHASAFKGKRLRLTVLTGAAPAAEPPAESLGEEFDAMAAPLNPSDTSMGEERSIEDEILELSRRIPEEERSRVPSDLTDQLDHYVYGTPKR